MLHEKILCVNTEPSSPKAKDSSRFGCAGVVNPGCSSYLGCRAPSIPEGQDLSRSSSNDSSLASVVEENETETTEDYDTGMVSTFTCTSLVLNAERRVRISRCLSSVHSRRVCRLPGRHTSETPSPTARGWRTAAAAPVPPVVVPPQVRQMWHLETSFLLQGIHKYLPPVFTHA